MNLNYFTASISLILHRIFSKILKVMHRHRIFGGTQKVLGWSKFEGLVES